MNRQFYKILVMIAICVAINNVFFIVYIEKNMAEKRALKQVSTSLENPKNTPLKPVRDAVEPLSSTQPRFGVSINNIKDTAELTEQEIEFISEILFKKLLAEDSFFEKVEEKFSQKGKRYLDKEKEFSRLSIREIYQIALSEEDPIIRQLAMDSILRDSLDDLENYELRNLHESNGHIDPNNKFLKILAKRGDSTALGWATDLVLSRSENVDVELLEIVGEQSLGAVKQALSGLPVNELVRQRSYVTYMGANKKLVSEYLEGNLESLLTSEDPRIPSLIKYLDVSLVLDDTNQARLIESLASNKLNTRKVAISLANNIDSPDLVNLAFSKLKSINDKQSFLSRLIYDQESKNIIELVRRLSSQEGIDFNSLYAP